jgi:hypothetical protein
MYSGPTADFGGNRKPLEESPMNRTPDALSHWPISQPDRESLLQAESRIPKIAVGRWFYFGTAVVFAVVAFAGFVPSYFMKVSNQTFNLPPIFHVHAVLFFSWTLINVAQTWFVATGRIYNHKKWGLLGISLATAMAISVVLLVVTGIQVAEAHGMGLPAKRFAYLNISGIAKFALLFGAAIAFVHRREIHKRLIVIANCTVIAAPLGRLVVMAVAPPALRAGPPPATAIFLLMVLAYLPVFAGMVYDWQSRGKPHWVYLLGVLSMATGLLVPVVSHTDTWLTIIDHLTTLLG